jgi:two-component system, OmpR family, response regulator
MIALMVEDSALVRGRLIPMLAAFSGVRVVATAETSDDALGWLGRHRVDLLLLDLSLRGGSGLALLRTLHERRDTRALRVVLTNGANAAVRRHCRALGADAVFDKSIELDELFAFLRREHCVFH